MKQKMKAIYRDAFAPLNLLKLNSIKGLSKQKQDDKR